MTDSTPAAPAPAPDTTPATPTPAGAPAGEEGELLALHAREPQVFEYSQFKDTGLTGAERLVEIRKAQETDKAEQEAEGDDLPDLDIAATEGEIGDGDEGDEASVKPIGPGDDATDEELDAWRAEHGVPDDPTDYEAPEVEGIEWDHEALTPILEAIHAHNIPQQAVADALTKYGERVKAQQAEIRQRDRENAKALRSELSELEIAAVKSAAKAMPAELRTMLNTARLPDGTRLVNQPDLLRMIVSTYGTGGEHQVVPQRQDHRTMMQQELRDLDQLMTTDIDAYHRPWRGTGQSGSDRRLAIMRELGSEGPAKPSAADLRAEMRELEALRSRDIQVFMYGDYRGTGRPAADRLVAIQSGRG